MTRVWRNSSDVTINDLHLTSQFCKSTNHDRRWYRAVKLTKVVRKASNWISPVRNFTLFLLDSSILTSRQLTIEPWHMTACIAPFASHLIRRYDNLTCLNWHEIFGYICKSDYCIMKFFALSHYTYYVSLEIPQRGNAPHDAISRSRMCAIRQLRTRNDSSVEIDVPMLTKIASWNRPIRKFADLSILKDNRLQKRIVLNLFDGCQKWRKNS